MNKNIEKKEGVVSSVSNIFRNMSEGIKDSIIDKNVSKGATSDRSDKSKAVTSVYDMKFTWPHWILVLYKMFSNIIDHIETAGMDENGKIIIRVTFKVFGISFTLELHADISHMGTLDAKSASVISSPVKLDKVALNGDLTVDVNSIIVDDALELRTQKGVMGVFKSANTSLNSLVKTKGASASIKELSAADHNLTARVISTANLQLKSMI